MHYNDNSNTNFEFGADTSTFEMPPQETPPQFYGVHLRDLSFDIGPRPLIYGHSLVRGMLSVLGGMGGVGKSAYMMSVLLSIALGKPVLSLGADEPEHRIYEPRGAVMYYSLEDPMDDLIRRIKAMLRHFGINPRHIQDNVILQSGRDLPLVVARMDAHGRMVRADIDPIVDYVLKNNLVCLGVDPFANSFEGDGAESSADAMKIICDQWRLVAHRANIPVWLAHHFRKGGIAGDADSFRGSTALQNAARVMETLTTMTREDAGALGVSEAERRQYMRLENAKVNLSAAPADGQWFRLIGVPLNNPTPKYPRGDVVGIPTRWLPTPVVISWSQVDLVLTTIEGRL